MRSVVVFLAAITAMALAALPPAGPAPLHIRSMRASSQAAAPDLAEAQVALGTGAQAQAQVQAQSQSQSQSAGEVAPVVVSVGGKGAPPDASNVLPLQKSEVRTFDETGKMTSAPPPSIEEEVPGLKDARARVDDTWSWLKRAINVDRWAGASRQTPREAAAYQPVTVHVGPNGPPPDAQILAPPATFNQPTRT